MRIALTILLIGFIIFNFKSKAKGGKKLELNQEVVVVNDIKLQAHIKTSKGDINIDLFPEVAPVTVANFVNLARRGYYDNLKFHRVIDNFMIQGGCPQGTGTGGPGYNFQDEFPVAPNEKYQFNRPGLLAMANAGAGTNGSQFFITHVPTDWLNNKHTIFGEVVSSEDQDVVNLVAGKDDMTTITITGDVEKFIEDNKALFDQLDEGLKADFPQLVK